MSPPDFWPGSGAARRGDWRNKFLDHMKKLLASGSVLHADETTGRAAAALSYVHVACTSYLTLMHVGDRCAATIDEIGRASCRERV